MSSPSTEQIMDKSRDRYPFCIVWTPLPLLTWLLPIIGHMGIALSNGVIRDFAGPYHVSEDNMAFGRPTKYLRMNPTLARNGVRGWDDGVTEASEIYKERMHNLCCDNCHSHVATALNLMEYDDSTKWNMVKLAILVAFRGRYVSFHGFLKTWLPFIFIATVVVILLVFMH